MMLRRELLGHLESLILAGILDNQDFRLVGLGLQEGQDLF
jgi:hypothetical protein